MAGMGRTWAVLVAGQHAERSAAGMSADARLTETRQLLTRSLAVAPPLTTCALIAEEYRQEWHDLGEYLPPRNLYPLPSGLPVMDGISRLLLAVRARDADANVILIPADHCANVESSWIEAARGALALSGNDRDAVYLLHDKPQNDPRPRGERPSMCSSSVMVGSIGALIDLCAGEREAVVVDLMVDEPKPRDEVPVAPPSNPATAAKLKVVHVTSIDEYVRLQEGRYVRPESTLVNVHV